MNDKNDQTEKQTSKIDMITQDVIQKQEMYSFYDMCKTDIEALDKMIFMIDHYCDASEVVDTN